MGENFDMRDLSEEVSNVNLNLIEYDLKELKIKVFEVNHPLIEIPLIFQNCFALDNALHPSENVRDKIAVKTYLEPIFLTILSSSTFQEKSFYNELKRIYEEDNSHQKFGSKKKIGRFCKAHEYFIKYRIYMAKRYFQETFSREVNEKNTFINYLMPEINGDENWDKVEELLIPRINPYSDVSKTTNLTGLNAKKYFAIQYRIMHILTRLIEDSGQPMQSIVNMGFLDVNFTVNFDTTQIVIPVIGHNEDDKNGTYDSVFLASYDEMFKRLQNIGYQSNYDSNLLLEMIIFSSTGLPIASEDLLIKDFPCKYTESLNQICFLIFYQEICLWLANSSINNDFSFPIAHAKCMILIENGFLQMENAFRTNSPYGIFTKQNSRNEIFSMIRTRRRIEELFSNKLKDVTDESVLTRVFG